MRNLLIALVLLFVVAVIGFTFLAPLYFGQNGESEPAEQAEREMPQLTEQEVEKLGPKNDLKELVWLPSNGSYGMIVHPKRLMDAPMVAEGRDMISQELIRVTMIPLDMSKIELLLSTTSFREVTIPPQPGMSVTPQVRPFPFVTYCVKTVEPLDKQAVLNSFCPPNQGFPIPKARTVEGKEVYDLPAGFPLKTHALAFVDEKTFLYVLADEEWLKDVLDGKAPTGPLADRMARVNVDATDVVFVGSAEAGLPPLSPADLEMFAKSNNIPETLVKVFFENFRAILLTLNLSAGENEPLLTAKLETLKPEGATEIAKILNEQLVFARSGLRMMQSQNTNPETTTPLLTPLTGATDDWLKAGNEALDALEVSSQDAVVSASLKRFADLSAYVAEFFQDRKKQIAEMAEQERQQQIFDSITQRLKAIRGYMLMYHNEKGHFPPSAICDAEGKPLLSWRVAILPYMGEKELYAQFKLDEPWDGPTNKPLISKMPAVFGDVRAYDPTRTTARLYNSEGTPFFKPELKMADVLAQQTTIMMVAVSPENASEWTRPESLAPCATFEEYEKIFGPNIPIVLFDGNGITILLKSIPESGRADFLARYKDMVEGKPIKQITNEK